MGAAGFGADLKLFRLLLLFGSLSLSVGVSRGPAILVKLCLPEGKATSIPIVIGMMNKVKPVRFRLRTDMVQRNNI
jgi:hypothetical protein